jgi:hypothetical protein
MDNSEKSKNTYGMWETTQKKADIEDYYANSLKKRAIIPLLPMKPTFRTPVSHPKKTDIFI